VGADGGDQRGAAGGRRGAERVPDADAAGRVATPLRLASAVQGKARPATGHVPAGDQPSHLGAEPPQEQQGRVQAHAHRVLRPVVVGCDHARVRASGRLLPLPLHGLPLRGVEAHVQTQAHPHLTSSEFVNS
jgi:arginase family enzyme